ncbi:hypothetical protein VKT23_001240 [Stygiomarasmius scandens]|uniref:Uncharacterized protein n=1 Tax=Marasmiellus scandens TaxID=2682957 RepID=A0ABR1K6Q6_9AGAR
MATTSSTTTSTSQSSFSTISSTAFLSETSLSSSLSSSIFTTSANGGVITITSVVAVTPTTPPGNNPPPPVIGERVTGPNVGAIVGGIIGGMVLAALITSAFFIWMTRKYRKPVVRSVPGNRLRDLEAIQGRPAPPRNPVMRIVETLAPSKKLGIMNWLAGVRAPSEPDNDEELHLQPSHVQRSAPSPAVEMTGPRDMVSNSNSNSSNSNSGGAGGGRATPAAWNASNAETQSLYSQSSYRASTLIEGTNSKLGHAQEPRLEQVPEESSGRVASPTVSPQAQAHEGGLDSKETRTEGLSQS